jgi:hypothetical protein
VLLKDVFCADATLHREGDEWWMFANSARPGEEINDELHLFRSDKLPGRLEAAPPQPGQVDVRSARPPARSSAAAEPLSARADLRAALRRRHRAAPRDAPHADEYRGGEAPHRPARATRCSASTPSTAPATSASPTPSRARSRF